MAIQSASVRRCTAGEAGGTMAPAAPVVVETLKVEDLDLSVFRDFASAAAAWRANECLSAGMPYQTLDWVQAWQSTVGQTQGIAPVLVIGYRAKDFAFALPLGLEQRRGYRLLTFLGQENTNQNTGLWQPKFYAQASTDTMSAVLGAVCRHVGADLVHFANLPKIWAGRPFPLLLPTRTDSPSPVFIGEVTDDFESLFKAHFGKESAKKLLRKQRKLEAAGGFRIIEAKTRPDLLRGLEAFFDQRARREAEAGIPSGFTTPDKQAFLKQLLLHDLDNGPRADGTGLSVWFLEADGAVRATYVAIRRADRLIAYSNSISQDELTAQSPGVILLKGLVEAACADPAIRVLDLGLGDESYKHRWSEPVTLVDAFLPVTLKGRLALRSQKLRQELKARIRNSAVLWPLVRKIRRFAQHLTA